MASTAITHTTHPVQAAPNDHMFYKKYVSIHSEDRDVTKYPNSAEFEIELPEEMLNVSAVQLSDWTFPANYNTFSAVQSNLWLVFALHPSPPSTEAQMEMYDRLQTVANRDWVIEIEEGFYTPQEMATALTNKCNAAISDEIGVPYTRFRVVYHEVSQKLWFGNTFDGFTLVNESPLVRRLADDALYCAARRQVADYSQWGLPGYLGLSRVNTLAVSDPPTRNHASIATIHGTTVPRFFYGDVEPGDDGYWLLPESVGTPVYWVESPHKVNLMGPSHMYLELEGMNCIDETYPFSLAPVVPRVNTNGTNGKVNGSFAKIPIPTTPITQWFDKGCPSFKWYLPAAERIRRLKVRMRYHNGLLVDFGVFDFTFTLEFTLQRPQLLPNTRDLVYPPFQRA